MLRLDMPNNLWSSEEDARLSRLAAQGLSPGQIAERTSRSVNAVYRRAKRLQVTLSKIRSAGAGSEIAWLSPKKK